MEGTRAPPESMMFERYTEKARRTIFFARYEASQLGQVYIKTEHILLGLLREDEALTQRFLRSHAAAASIRREVQAHTAVREKVSTSTDLPLTDQSKQVLKYAAEEADQLGNKHIGTEHLFLGLLREKTFAGRDPKASPEPSGILEGRRREPRLTGNPG